MKKWSFSVGFLVFLFCFQVSIYAQTNRISGMVLAQNNKAVPDLWVLLTNDVGSILGRTKTDGSGRYFFTGMSGGKFYIRVLTAGTDFQEQTQEVELINFNLGGRTSSDSIQVDFYLRPNKENNNEFRVNQVVFAQEIPKEAEILFKKALSDFETKRNQEGIVALKNAIEIFPAYFLALERLGIELIKLENYSEAREFLIRSVGVNPKTFQSWYGLAFANSALGKTADALVASKKVVEISPNSVEGLIILAISLRSNKQYQEAATALLKAKSINKNKNANINWNLALLYYYNLKLYKETADELETYLRLLPELPKDKVESIKKLIVNCRELEKKVNFSSIFE